jgi:betaine-aldehyde dehydrogenase
MGTDQKLPAGRPALSGATMPVVNPATGETIGEVPRCDARDVDRAVAQAVGAYPAWRRTHPDERAQLLLDFADAVWADRERLLDLEVLDNGSPRRFLEPDIAIGVRYLRYFAGLAFEVRGQTIPVGAGRLDFTAREPFGVVARIIPFNHPIFFFLCRMAPPLVTGNTLIVKPSEYTSLTALALVDLLDKVFPPGVVSVLSGLGEEVGDALVTHPEVRRIAFIGSDEIGRLIQRRAAEVGVKEVTLELGGKSPLIVFDDADFESALLGAVAGTRHNFQGQACASTTRVFVQRGIYDEFVRRLGERLEGLNVGLPDDPEADLSAVVSRQQLERVLDYVAIGKEEGARLVTGGYRVESGDLAAGCFVRPTLFADVDPAGRLAQEEIFGPVIAAMPFDDYEDAIALANQTQFGLAASVYTADLSKALRFADEVEAGYVWVNENQRHFLGTPYGGFKDSGIGKEEDMGELESYTRVKNVHIAYEVGA